MSPPPLPSSAHAATTLRAEGIGVRMGGNRLLDRVNLELQAGEVGAVLGPNGAGKSTLLSVLSGLRTPDEGHVCLGNRLLSQMPAEQQARERAVLPQDTGVAFDFTVQDVVELGRFPHRLQPAADEATIAQAAMRLTEVALLAHRNVNSLGGGERARICAGAEQIWHPLPDGRSRWLLLDEPTAALDLRHQHSTLATVRRWAASKAWVCSRSCDLNLALRYADRVLGSAPRPTGSQRPPAQLLTPALLQQVWRVHARLVHDNDGCPQLLIRA
ncbi:MAG: ATP-binding cassette domain-containing protein [Burkholderiaceae bacterium]